MKVDLYNHEKLYKSWKENINKFGESDLTKPNSDLLIQYILDMEIGNNVSSKSKKGARSYHRLNNVRQKISKVLRFLQQRNILDIRKVKDIDLQKLFDDMRKGEIKTDKGEIYKSVVDYIKAFKSFWHWYMKVNVKKGKLIQDITEYLDTRQETKPKWVFLDDSQIKQIFQKSNGRYAMLFEFLYDSGARVTETFSLKVKDVEVNNKVVSVTISDEIAKSIGRKIKLLLCGENLIKYIQENDLKPDDPLFPVSNDYANYYLRNLAKDLFGEGESKAGEKYSKMSLYDFRHNSACFWVQRYKTESLIMYRFGWKSSKYIHYYTEFLGMKDSIREEDLYVDITKTELERKIEGQNKDIDNLKKSLTQTQKMVKDMIKLNQRLRGIPGETEE